jgi:uncharacterized membrane protein
MELMLLVALVLSILPWVLVFMVFYHRREIRTLRERLDHLEREWMRRPSPPEVMVPAPAAPKPWDVAAVDARVSAATTEPTAPVPPQTHALPPPPVRSPIPAPHVPRSRYDERPTEPRERLDPTRLEQQIGGIWLQNVGSVLLLLGAFFLIVWGYATRRIGPEILILAGVLLGMVVAWRGNVIARTLQALGNALIGVGLGTIYITLYVGHFRMDVLPQWAAFTFLAVVALATVAIGLRRREPIIATLGVMGAFLPQLMAVWIPLQGFRLPLPTLLAYFAVVNGVVFMLAATVGWSGLVIFSMLLTAWTWAANATGGWSFATQLGLTALFAGLGLAPVVRLARVPAPVRNLDLLVVALAPLLLLLCSIPYLAHEGRVRAAWLLGGLGVVYIGGAIWIESRRERRDLWKPLTGAATVFVAAALERGIDPEHLAMAWAAEGVVLVALGLGPGRDAWLRLLGYGVSFLSGCWLTYILLTHWGGAGDPGFLHVTALRDLFCVAALLAVSHLVGRRRDVLTESERGMVPGLAVVVSNLLLMIWTAREAFRLRHVLPAIAGPEAASVAYALTGVAWLLHALTLIGLGRRPGAAVLRHTGYLVGAFGTLALLGGYGTGYFWKPQATPFVSTTALLAAMGIVVAAACSILLWRDRERLGPSERQMPEVVAGGANLMLMVWIAREAVRLREVLPGIQGPGASTASWTLTALGWLLQALSLMALAKRLDASVLRHFGYVVGGAGTLALWIGHATADVWKQGQPPFGNTAAVIAGLGILVLIASSELLWRSRGRLGPSERRMPEVVAGAANLLLLTWWAREAGHLAATLDPAGVRAGGGARTLAAIFTSAAWTLQAIVLFGIGWIRNSAFLRWSGLVLFGLTVLKFLAVDLDRVDAFWRFAGAVGIGAALLVVSFLYQRRSRRQADSLRERPEVAGTEAP